jgi:DNA recombination protein RmuC
MTALDVVLAIALLAAGVWIVTLLGRTSKLAAERDLAREREGDVERNAAQLKDSFRALAGESLQQSSEQFLRLAEQKLSAQQTSAMAEMDKRKALVDQLIQPIGEALKKTQEELRKIETARVDAYSGLRAQVQGIATTHDDLRRETARLVQALSNPNVRGRYGEIQLQRVAELAGMRAFCDFALQDAVRDGQGRLLKPDMTVRLPNERIIAVDAKTNISAYIEALKAATAAEAEPLMERFAQTVVEQVQALGKKNYWREFADSPEFVVMFVPGDQFVDAALARRPDLIDLAAQSNVILASPSTLIGLLRAVSVGWREKQLGDNARELLKLGKELHGRVATALGYSDKLGRSLKSAVEDYNQFVASIEARVLPTLRRFEESGTQVGEPIKELKPVESVVRASPVLDRPALDKPLQPEQVNEP